MARFPHWVPRGIAVAMVGALFFSLLMPFAASADTDLVIGGTARIAYANGDPVALRGAVGYDAEVLAWIPEGTTVEVVDGPKAASDGALWYKVHVNGQSGYIVSYFLAASDGGSAPQDSPEASEPATSDDGSAVPGEITGIAYIAGTNNDGVRCRADASTSGAVITVLLEGTRVELIGDQTNGWQPVNCNGRAGFVSAEFVSASAPESSSGDTSGATDTPTGGGDEITGSGTIYNTNGDGIRCRAGAGYDKNVITVLTEGQKVDLRGASATEWQPVFCAGRKGFIHKDFVKVGGSATQSSGSTEATLSGSATGTATVSGTNGGGLNCRSSASYSGSVIAVLAEGTKVSLRGAVQGDWQPVTCSSRNGFVHKAYLKIGSTSSGSASTSSSSSGSSVYASIVGTATVRTDDGSGLNCRAGAGYNYRVITVLANGSSIDIRGRGYGDWTPVVCAGRKAYVLKLYVDFGNGATAGNGGSSSSGSSSSGLVAGDNAKVSGTNGTGVRFRSGASTSASIISVLAEGTVVKVRSGSTGSWVAVTYNGSNGYIHKDYLRKTSQSVSNPSAGDGGGSSGGGYRLANGDHAKVTSNLNLRYSPSFSSGVAAVVAKGTVVLITGTPRSGFYPVDYDGLKGYMYTDYLSKTSEALSSRGGSGDNDTNSDNGDSGGGGGSGDATGNSIVNYAMQYIGYPYVWATHGPGSFDCSGFTYWVILNTLGKNIGAGLWTQVAAGTPVNRSNLQPGDLVFFQNTYTWGLSHVGVYIGNDQFIHAENASTGVKISSLSSQYYSSRWYGAVRIR